MSDRFDLVPSDSVWVTRSQIIKLPFVKLLGGYLYKCDDVWLVYVVEKNSVG